MKVSGRTIVSVIGVVMGLGGASHGPGEMLQGISASESMMIEAWPSLTQLGGEPAMTVVPSFLLTGILAIMLGLAVATWSARYVNRKNGYATLILLAVLMLLLGGGIVPPIIVIADGLAGAWISRRDARKASGGIILG